MTEEPTTPDQAAEDTALAETAACIDCYAPPGTPCRIQAGYPYHATRLDTARLRAAEHGTCALCSRPMVRLTRPDGLLDAFHPNTIHAAACPVLPDPAVNWNAYATAVNLGQSPGRPGIEHFVPTDAAPVCAACRHAAHGEEECEEVTGYDHMNGDHECGCPGEDAARELDAQIDRLHGPGAAAALDAAIADGSIFGEGPDA